MIEQREQPFARPVAHIPGLDGIRGIAILAIIVFHVPNAPHGRFLNSIVGHAANLGWMGVDLFFVLSGFLITGILIDTRSSEGYFRTFYARRALRILPVYVVFLCFWMWIAPLVGALPAETAQRLRDSQGWYWSFLINVMIAVRGWTAAAGGPTHLWSLAVEEQFYLIWPVIVLLAAPRSLPWIAVGCIVLAELCRLAIVIWGADPRVNYLLLPTRMDTLAVGAFLACAVRSPQLLRGVIRWRMRITCIAILVLLLIWMYAHALDYQRSLVQLVAYPAIALLSGALVLAATQPSSFLATRTLRFFGRYSYGMYVWHWLIVVVLARKTALLEASVGLGWSLERYALAVSIVIAATTAVALASWYLIEQPILRLKRYAPYADPGIERSAFSGIGVSG